MNDLERRIRDRVDAFVEELTDLIRQAALESVKEALGSAESPPPRAKQKRTGRVVGKKRSGGKRSAEELARSEGAIATFVAKHPGARAETKTYADI